MHYFSHIAVVMLLALGLVGAGQAQATYSTHSDCKSGVETALEELDDVNVGEGGDAGDLAAERDYSPAHCSYCWAQLPIGNGLEPLSFAALHAFVNQHLREGRASALIERPPISVSAAIL